MKIRELVVSVFTTAVLLFAFSCEMPEKEVGVDQEAEKSSIDSIVEVTRQAVEAQDLNGLKEVAAEDFTIHFNGEVRNLNEFHQNMVEISQNYKANVMKDKILLSEDGSMALWTGKDEFTVTLRGQDLPPTVATMSIVLVNRDGKWKVQHIARTLPMPPMPDKVKKDTIETGKK